MSALPSASALPAPTAAALPVAARALQPATSVPPRALESTELLRGHKAVEIVHNGAVYRLQATKLGKLILTK